MPCAEIGERPVRCAPTHVRQLERRSGDTKPSRRFAFKLRGWRDAVGAIARAVAPEGLGRAKWAKHGSSIIMSDKQ